MRDFGFGGLALRDVLDRAGQAPVSAVPGHVAGPVPASAPRTVPNSGHDAGSRRVPLGPQLHGVGPAIGESLLD